MIRLLSLLAVLLSLTASGDDSPAAPLSPGVGLVQNATSSGLPTVTEFGAETCDSCREMKVVLDRVARKTQGQVHVLVIDITKDWSSAQFFRIQMMPTQIFFNPDGREMWRHKEKLSEAEASPGWV